MSFIDEVKLHLSAGAGGNGCVAFRREPYKPKGGPDGGDGGDGGSVIVRADPSVATLLELRDHPHVRAAHGGHGESKRRHGGRGADRVVLVPPGTIVHEGDTLLADLARPGDELVAAKGGRGGRGNARFATASRRAPDFSEGGEPGESLSLHLELRLLADVGLVGFPNAGKSTLIARISAARPKVGDYPFTTLEPHLGVVRRDDESFIMADIPGLVPGAHEGKGLGHRFLRHISRTALLAFVVDLAAMERDPARDLEALRAELAHYDPELASRRHVVIATKLDAGRHRLGDVLAAAPHTMAVSAVTGEGMEALLDVLFEEVVPARLLAPRSSGYLRHVVRADPIQVERESDGAWRVTGRRPERAVAGTNMHNEEAVARMQRRLIVLGVERALAEAGAGRGDEVRIGDQAFDFEPEGEL